VYKLRFLIQSYRIDYSVFSALIKVSLWN